MPSPLSREPMPSARALRASLFARPATVAFRGPGDAHGDGLAGPPPPLAAAPSAAEVLSATPALVRLCESYHRAQAQMISRGRRQRIGIFLLICAISVCSVLLLRGGALTANLANDLVLTAAGASCMSVGVLALLWMRDERRLRSLQGERLLRAVQANCTLPSERVVAWRRGIEPVGAFFDCYSVWRSSHVVHRASGLLRPLRSTRA